MCAAVFLVYLIRAAVFLLASLAVIAQFPVPYNGPRRTSAIYSFSVPFCETILWIKHVVVVLEYTRIVTISFGCILYSVCFNLFRNMWVSVCVGFVMCGCSGNMCTCIYCVLYCLYCVFVLVRLCIFIPICFVWY